MGKEGATVAPLILVKKMVDKVGGEEEEVRQEEGSERAGCHPPEAYAPPDFPTHGGPIIPDFFLTSFYF
jgi:hypothetical protein